MFDYQCSISQSNSVEDFKPVSRGMLRTSATASNLSSKYVALSLGRRGCALLTSVICGMDTSIGSQIAVKMAMDALVDEALRFGVARQSTDIPCGDKFTLEVVRAGFKEANRHVYEYSHRMNAGGQICATGVVGVYDGQKVSIGQVGGYESFLWRAGKLFRFYENNSYNKTQSPNERESYIGVHSKILVELASVEVEKDDLVIVTTLAPSEGFMNAVEEVLGGTDSLDVACQDLANMGRSLSQSESVTGERVAGAIETSDAVVFMIKVGAPTIDLRDVIFDE